MLYQPNYCCHCGEKIERVEWKLWTSRRFCEHCEIAFRKEDWLPKIGAGFALIFGLFGFGSYLKSPEKPLSVTTNQLVAGSANKAPNVGNEYLGMNGNKNILPKNISSNIQNVNQSTATVPPRKEKISLGENQQNQTAEPVYFCGAQTKKGNACTRRVKGNVRCWQHEGQPAMLPREKLVASQ